MSGAFIMLGLLNFIDKSEKIKQLNKDHTPDAAAFPILQSFK